MLNLKRIRLALGLTQAELAQRARVTKQYVTMLERGQRDPSLSVLRKLAKALDVPLSMLVGD
jgi:transcriptional regulator with XRE-family HTH domain